MEIWIGTQRFSTIICGKGSLKPIFIISLYCLLKNKTQNSYEKMLDKIIVKYAEHNLHLDQTYIHIDFEKSVINAIK